MPALSPFSMRLLRVLPILLSGSLIVPMVVLADSSSANSSSVGTSSSTVSSSSAISSVSGIGKTRRKTLQPVTMSCIQTAVDAREQAVLSALGTYTSSVVSAFQTKKTALYAAWALSDAAQRKAAIKNAWTVFAQSKKSARETYKSARQTAWSTFKKTAKTCNEPMSDEGYSAHEDL